MAFEPVSGAKSDILIFGRHRRDYGLTLISPQLFMMFITVFEYPVLRS